MLAVAVENLVKRYGDTVAAAGISFRTNEREFLTLLGPSGCGKTTTLRCLAGFIRPDAGRIRFGSRDVTDLPPYRRDFGMVFQGYALFPHLTVFENVAFGLRVRKVPKSRIAARVARALDLVRLEGLAGRLPKQLSGGQQQRAALARALVYEPQILLLDEPLSNLDARLRVEMRSEIRALQQRLGITAIYVTHDQEEALSISDRVMVLRAGRIEQLATPWEVYHRPATPFVAGFVGAANILAASITAGMLVLPGGARLPLPPGTPPSARRVWAVVRPENLRLCNGGGIQGEVEQVAMLGAVQRLEVRIAPGHSLKVDLREAAPAAFASGAPVAIALDPAHLILLPHENEAPDAGPDR